MGRGASVLRSGSMMTCATKGDAMGLESAVEKLDKYFKRLDKGKVQKIKPQSIEKVIRKLEAKAVLLRSEFAETDKEAKKHRLERKIELVQEQQNRALWLLEKISAH
jgi:hypothetical protein